MSEWTSFTHWPGASGCSYLGWLRTPVRGSAVVWRLSGGHVLQCTWRTACANGRQLNSFTQHSGLLMTAAHGEVWGSELVWMKGELLSVWKLFSCVLPRECVWRLSKHCIIFVGVWVALPFFPVASMYVCG